MPRRNAFERIAHEPSQPISHIPPAKERRRENRAWDQAHRGKSYFIPAHLAEQAKDVRAAILGLSQKHMTNTSSVATALISFSLAHVRHGKLTIEGRPNVHHRKMLLTWDEVDGGWPQDIPQPEKRINKKDAEDVYLNYRWGRDVDIQVKALAGTAILVGEVVLLLLRYAIDAHKQGRLRLKEETIVVSQKVSASW